MRKIVYGLSLLTSSLCCHADIENQPEIVFQTKTVAGVMKLIERESGCKYSLTVGEREVISTDCTSSSNSKYPSEPIPFIYASFKEGVKPFDEVYVIQRLSGGNACSGGPFQIVGITAPNTVSVTNEIPFCGGVDVTLKWSHDKLEVDLISQLNSSNSSLSIPGSTWRFEAGKLIKLKS
jgi:hypothetical protein